MASPSTPAARPASVGPSARPEFLVIVGIGALARFWRLFTPNAVVFDEYHYLRYSGHYFSHRFYFDLHPPLAKLMYAALAKLLAIPPGVLLHPSPAPMLRVLPASCGTLTVALVYVLLSQLGASRAIAALGAFAVALDNALVADSRFVLLEPLMICFALLGVVCFFAARERRGAARWAFLVAAGLALGCAASVKWTGLSGLGIVLCVWLYDWIRAGGFRARAVATPALLTVLAVAVYVASFAIHFALLTKSSETTDDAFMSVQFRKTLEGDQYYEPHARMSLLGRMRDTQHAIDVGNRGLEYLTHPSASPWYTWPIMKHPIGMWVAPGTPAAGAASPYIILLGNPVVWWGGLVGFGLAVLLVTAWRTRAGPHRFAFAVLFGGFAINFLPFIPITRLMYLYHYLFALIWITMLGAFSIGILSGWSQVSDAGPWAFPSKRSRTLYLAIAGLIVVGFAYFSPFTYGFHLSARAYDQHFWVLHPHL